MYRTALQTGQTDGRTDDRMLSIADRTVYLYKR